MIDSEKIKTLMEKKKIKSSEMACAVGVSGAMMTYITQGLREPNVTTLARIAAKLGCTVDELIVKE